MTCERRAIVQDVIQCLIALGRDVGLDAFRLDFAAVLQDHRRLEREEGACGSPRFAVTVPPLNPATIESASSGVTC